MTSPYTAFDADLDRILSMRVDPVVPADLARRIVVRTTCLPQASPPENRYMRKLPSPYWPVGAAMAASVAVFFIGHRPYEAPNVGPVVQSDVAALASADTVAPYQHLSAEASAAPAPNGRSVPAAKAPLSTPRLAIARGPSEHSVKASSVEKPIATASVSLAKPAAQLAEDDTNSEMLEPRVDLTRSQFAVNEFTLAENPAEPVAVYGPVLEPEAKSLHSGLARGAPAVGLAVAASASSSGAR